MQIYILDYWTQVTWELQGREALTASFVADEGIFIKMSCTKWFDL